MKIEFSNRLDAIEWIAANTENEAQFEVLREELNFNYIYTNSFFLEIDEEEEIKEVVWLK